MAIRVLIIHKNITSTNEATVNISLDKYGITKVTIDWQIRSIAADYIQNAQLIRLTAPNAWAKTGINLAGQTFDGSNDGKPQGLFIVAILIFVNCLIGNRTYEIVTANGDNIFSFKVDPASAVMVEIVSKSSSVDTNQIKNEAGNTTSPISTNTISSTGEVNNGISLVNSRFLFLLLLVAIKMI